jgi:hypothetical protein
MNASRMALAPTAATLPPLRTQINIPIRVSVASLNNQRMVYVDQPHVSIGYQQYGTIIWTLDPNSGVSFDLNRGIVFSDGIPEGAQQLIISAQQCVMLVDNRGSLLERLPRNYSVVLDDGSTTITDDPTVENDPPPPQS